jgi:hypothetical protein
MEAGFAKRKQGPVLCIIDPLIIDTYEDKIEGLCTGRSCVKFKGNKNTSIAEVRIPGKKNAE